MNVKVAFCAIVGALACLTGGAADAQDGGRRLHGHEDGRGGPQGYEAYRAGPPPGRREPGGAAWGYPPPLYSPPRYPSPPPRRPAQAAPGWRGAPQDTVGMGLRGGRVASLGWVIETIERRSPGRELDAVVEYMDGRPVYRVLWITTRGRRMDYLVDAETGAIIFGR